MNKTFRILTRGCYIVLGGLILLFLILGTVEAWDSAKPYVRPDYSLLYAVEDGRYSDLLEAYHQNAVCDTSPSESMKELYAVAQYYEAAINYQMAQMENDSALLERSKETMEAAAGRMGSVSYAKADIDRLFSLNDL